MYLKPHLQLNKYMRNWFFQRSSTTAAAYIVRQPSKSAHNLQGKKRSKFRSINNMQIYVRCSLPTVFFERCRNRPLTGAHPRFHHDMTIQNHHASRPLAVEELHCPPLEWAIAWMYVKNQKTPCSLRGKAERKEQCVDSQSRPLVHARNSENQKSLRWDQQKLSSV